MTIFVTNILAIKFSIDASIAIGMRVPILRISSIDYSLVSELS